LEAEGWAEPERFALQDAWSNQMDNKSGEMHGVFFNRTAIDIDGVPVERRTAMQWEKEGLLAPGSVANALPHTGWSPDNSPTGRNSE
jgi:hypothetical protein